ncbi:hypothetical protein LCGC14_1548410 [marine sediment metagenome]|uniref:Uncharacterized protein n=1 Tax=marine sediment metagenome TaxID=412755 RepID=A0A0F9IR34_9ZZZZ
MSALTMDYFRNLKKGAIVTLHYNLYNKGTFVWLHDHVGPDGDSSHADDSNDCVWGKFAYPGDSFTERTDPYLYEHMGVVCRGSGAEPVHLEMPKDMTEDDWEDMYK